MFKSKDPDEKTKAAPARSTQATQAVAAILKELGRNAFDTKMRPAAELAEQCDAWIAHLLSGAPSPSHPDPEKQSWLDWPGVRDFVARERAAEREYVVDSLGDLRTVLLGVGSGLAESVAAEQESGEGLREQIDQMRTTIESSPDQDLRNAARSVVTRLNEFVEARQSAQEDRLRALSSQVEALKRELERTRRVAEVNALTQIFNRRSFDDRLVEAMDVGRLSEKPQMLLLLDIDHFKKFNDTHGHPFGDQVLQAFAKVLGTVFARAEDFVARYGGEEFAVIASCEVVFAKTLGDRLLQAIREMKIEKDGTTVTITASAGLAMLTDEDTAGTWVERADQALYASKQHGRDQMTIKG